MGKDTIVELCIDFGFLNDRITGTLEYYQMSTKDMIMRQPLSNFTGFENITTNLGQVNNSGFEVALNTLNIDKKNFQWSSSFSLSYNKNRIKHLFGDRQDIVDANGTVVGSEKRIMWQPDGLLINLLVRFGIIK